MLQQDLLDMMSFGLFQGVAQVRIKGAIG